MLLCEIPPRLPDLLRQLGMTPLIVYCAVGVEGSGEEGDGVVDVFVGGFDGDVVEPWHCDGRSSVSAGKVMTVSKQDSLSHS